VGISPFKSSICRSEPQSCGFVPKSSCTHFDEVPPPSGNPDPGAYKILAAEELGNYLIATIEYPNCHNYEGKKILLFHNVTKKQLRSQKRIDPHFCDNTNHISPVARFEPTERGLLMARTLAASFS